jgi:hypothetical protein
MRAVNDNTVTMVSRRGAWRRAALVCASFVAAALLTASASSAQAAPALRVTTSIPDHVTAGKFVSWTVSVQNVGDQPMSGNLTITYTYPAEFPFFIEEPFQSDPGPRPTACTATGQVQECVIDVTGIGPQRQMRYQAFAFVEPGASGTLSGQIEVSGGGSGDDVIVPVSMTTDPIGPFEVESFGVGMSDGPTLHATQAGSNPTDVATGVTLPSQAKSNLGQPGLTAVAPSESFRDVVVHVPPGFLGDPTSTPARCTTAELAKQSPVTVAQISSCPQDSQIGLIQLKGGDIVPVYNLVPPQGSPAAFGLWYQSVVVELRASLRPSDNGVDIVTEKAPSSIPIEAFDVTLWGTPADSSHNLMRPECILVYGFGNNGNVCPTEAQPTPFLRTPTSCSGQPLPWEIEMNTYQHPGTFVTKKTTTPAIEGCEDVPFDPEVAVASPQHSAHAPGGLDVNLSMPQGRSVNGLAESDVRSATVTLPQGVAVNPASADGLQACSDEQLRLGLEGPSNCPDAAKLGSVEIDTPLLEEPLGGSVYLRTQASKDPASGEMYRLAIVLHSAERGVDVKLPGSLVADPQTGQLTTRFTDLPQLPFESMQLHLKSGPRAPLTTPSSCGTYTTHAELTPWARPEESVPLDSSFTIDQGCSAPGFAPGFEAGVTNPTAGGFSPFTLRVTRDSGQPNLSRIDATLPEGELAKLAGVPVCSDAQAAAANCPAASRIGATVAGVGEGTSPLYLPQPGKSPTAVYLAGPYKGAPYSILAAVPAQAGPFDLGTVTVRSALRVDPVTTRASVLSDPLPQIFGGIPVAYRDVRVQVDRPEFTVNPTSCEPQSVDGTIAAANGAGAAVSDRFQATDCAALGFKPGLSLKLTGPTGRAAHPKLRATLRMPKGGANIARASVALPGSEFLDQAHIRTICTRVQYAAGAGGGEACPPGSVYGHATAYTPLLDQPLRGPVFLRSSNHNLPDLVASLDGAIHVDLDGRIDTDRRHGIRTTFEAVPDAPVSKFVLTMKGGDKGLLQNSENLCEGTHRATVRFGAQNGRSRAFAPQLKAECGLRQGKAPRHHRK